MNGPSAICAVQRQIKGLAAKQEYDELRRGRPGAVQISLKRSDNSGKAMATLAPVTAITASLLVPIYIALAFGVIKKRHQHRVAVGSGNNPDLETAIRAHGNFGEYVPFTLLLLLIAEINGSPAWLLAVVAIMLIGGRLVHARAIPAGDLKKRVLGMKLTFGALAIGAVANLIAVFYGLLVSN
jgi:hypothetical protein